MIRRQTDSEFMADDELVEAWERAHEAEDAPAIEAVTREVEKRRQGDAEKRGLNL